MQPEFKILPYKKLIGKRIRMSLSKNLTFELWSGFMPVRKKITNAVTSDLFSLQVYDGSFDFANFNPDAEFDKWAAAEVTDFKIIPEGMETLTLKEGLYAVFIHKGPASSGEKTFRYIFETWLPDSGYRIDNRPHFEVLGEKYKNEDPASEEEIWIPVAEIKPSDK